LRNRGVSIFYQLPLGVVALYLQPPVAVARQARPCAASEVGWGGDPPEGLRAGGQDGAAWDAAATPAASLVRAASPEKASSE